MLNTKQVFFFCSVIVCLIGCNKNGTNRNEETDNIVNQNNAILNQFIKDLASHTWHLYLYGERSKNTKSNDLPITLKFDEKGHFKANFCNAIRGDYKFNVENNSVVLSNFIRTKKLCAESSIMAIENLLQPNTYTLSITKGILEMENDEAYFAFNRNAGNENQMSEDWDNFDKEQVHIVLFKEKTTLKAVRAIIKKYKLKEKNIYDISDSYRGFAAPMPAFIIEEINKEPSVISVEKDQEIKADSSKKIDKRLP